MTADEALGHAADELRLASKDADTFSSSAIARSLTAFGWLLLADRLTGSTNQPATPPSGPTDP